MTKNEQNKNFYTIFNQLLEENGLSPYKLAKNTGMSASTIRRYKTNPNCSPVAKHITKIANYFGVSTSYMTGETDVTNADEKEIGDELGIDHKTMENLRKIKDINSKYNNHYKDLLSEVITNPSLYQELVKQTNIMLNKDLKKCANEKIEENKKRIFGKDDISEYDDFASILICQKFLEYYNTYITFKFPVNLTENQLKTRETELKKQLKAVQIQLKKYK